MPTVLDFFLLGVMLISGLLAMIRGFMREVLSIGAWGAAAGIAAYSYFKLVPTVKPLLNIDSDLIASAVVVVGTFLVTLIVVSVITAAISDKVLDSRIGALDRTLGFMFGLARGLLIVAVAYVFFDWLAPQTKPKWIADAKSQPALRKTGDWLISMSPDLEAWYAKAKGRKGPDGEPQDVPPDRSDSGAALKFAGGRTAD